MIIVEGPDGAGKTTLVAELETRLGITRQPRAVTKEAKSLTPIDQYITAELAQGFGLRLYDRFALISSPMYMHLPDRTFAGAMKDPIWLEEAYRVFAAVDPVVILCLPPLETVLANVIGDEDNEVVQSSIETIYLNYHNWYCQQKARLNTSVLLYNYDETEPWKVTRQQDNLSGLLGWAKARTAKGREWTTPSN